MDNKKAGNKIMTELGLDVKDVLEFDRNRKYEFLYCGAFDGPISGQRAEKCR